MRVGDNLDSKGYGIAAPIGSDLIRKVNLAVLHLREDGFLDTLQKRWWLDGSECGQKDVSKSSPISLLNVSGVIYILIVGLFLSLIITFFNLIYSSYTESSRNKVNFFFHIF
jgi:ionotropic glutamate receptor